MATAQRRRHGVARPAGARRALAAAYGGGVLRALLVATTPFLWLSRVSVSLEQASFAFGGARRNVRVRAPACLAWRPIKQRRDIKQARRCSTFGDALGGGGADQSALPVTLQRTTGDDDKAAGGQRAFVPRVARARA